MSSDALEGDDIWGDAADQGEAKQDEPAAAAAAAEEALDADDEDTQHMSISELRQRTHLINNDIRIMKSDVQRITHESRAQKDRIRENQEKVKLNKQLPYLVANVVEVLEPDAEDGKFLMSLYLCCGVVHLGLYVMFLGCLYISCSSLTLYTRVHFILQDSRKKMPKPATLWIRTRIAKRDRRLYAPVRDKPYSYRFPGSSIPRS
jgi:hypothetical protein